MSERSRYWLSWAALLVGAACDGRPLEPVPLPEPTDVGPGDSGWASDRDAGTSFLDAGHPDVGGASSGYPGNGWLGIDRWERPAVFDGSERCDILEGRHSGEPGSLLEFESCGEGCTTASLVFAPAEFVGNPALSTDGRSGHAILTMQVLGVADELSERNQALLVADLVENHLLTSALALYSRETSDVYCSLIGFPNDALTIEASSFESISMGLGPRVVYGYSDTNGWTWRAPWVDLGIDDRAGCALPYSHQGTEPLHVLTACRSALKVWKEPESEPETIATADFAFSRGGTGFAGTTYLIEGMQNDQFRIRTYTPTVSDDALGSLGAPGPGWPCDVGVSDSSVAVITGDVLERNGYCNSYVENPRLLVFDRHSGARRELALGSGRDAGGTIRTWGDYVFASLGESGDYTFLLIRLSDGAIREITPQNLQTGNEWDPGAYTLDADSLWLLERRIHANDQQRARRVYRLALDHFESIGVPWTPEP